MIQNYSQEVFSGNRLFDTCQYQEDDPHFFLMGHSAQGEPMRIPVGEQMLSRHLLLLGGHRHRQIQRLSFSHPQCAQQPH